MSLIFLDFYFGHGYDITGEQFVPAQVMKFSTKVDEMFGFSIPRCAQIESVNDTQEFQMDFQSDESYVESRLKNLGLSISVQTILSMAPQFGFSASQKNDKKSQSSETKKTTLTEYRLAKICIGNLESKDVQFTSEFSSAVANLPDRYTNEEKNKREFQTFFDRFGQFMVTSAFIGGAIEEEICNESSEKSKHNENNAINASAGANVSGVAKINMSDKHQPSIDSTKNTIFSTKKIRWQGGRRDLHQKSELQSWKKSLSEEPKFLTNEMRLKPISSLVTLIDKTKGDVCHQALCDMFKNDLRPVRNRQDERVLEEKSKLLEEKQEKQRNESNSREETAKDPDTKGWWDTITGSPVIAGGTILTIIGGVATVLYFIVKK